MSSKCPKEFFKIVQNHELHNGELRLPKTFVKNHWKETSNPVVLRLPNGDKHKISWVKRHGDIWLQKNWENIAKFLKFGYVIVFKYKGKSKFEVKIFGLNTLEIDYSIIPKFIDYVVDDSDESEIHSDDDDDDDDDDESEIRRQSQKTKKGKRKMNGDDDDDDDDDDESLDGQMNGVGTSQRRKTWKRKMNSRKRGYMIKKAKKCSTSEAVNGNPSFEVKLSKSYALPNGDTLRIPSEFSQKYLKWYEGTASIRVDEDMAMEVNVKFRDIDYNRTSFICKGWNSFIQRYNLRVGDICKFEMIQCQPLSFIVTIIRAQSTEGTSRSCHVHSNLEGGNVMQPHIIEICVTTDYPHIHSEFFDRHRELHDKNVKLKMGRESWNVKVKFYGETCRFYRGWRPFKNDCKLKNGDSCFLKLIDEEKLVFEVSFERMHHH